MLKQPSWRYLRNRATPAGGETSVEIASRRRLAAHRARDEGRGPEALLIGNQLTIWVSRPDAEARSFVQYSRWRRCHLEWLISFTFEDDRCVAVTCTETAPAPIFKVA